MSDNNQIKVLVVDDDPDLLKSYEFLLPVAGFQIVTATNSVEAKQQLSRYSPQVALVDLKISTESGIDLAAALKQIDPLLETIIITGFPSHETAVKALKTGAFDYLPKTSESESIIETIREALAQRELKVAQQGLTGYHEGEIPVAVVCNHTMVQKGFLHFFSRSKSLRLACFFPHIPMLLKNAPAESFEILLICGECNFHEAAESLSIIGNLRQAFINQKIAIFNEDFPEEVRITLVKLGLSGFLEVDLSEEEMENILMLIHRGEVWAPSGILSRALHELSREFVSQQPAVPAGEQESEAFLTTREKEIIKCLARGLKNKEIGGILFISEKTVKSHINNIFRKLGAETRLQAITIAHERKLLY